MDNNIKWWMKLKTPTEKLLAALAFAIITIGGLYLKEVLENKDDLRISKAETIKERTAKEAALIEVSICKVNCLKEQLLVVQEALAKQEELNNHNKTVNEASAIVNSTLQGSVQTNNKLVKKLNTVIKKKL